MKFHIKAGFTIAAIGVFFLSGFSVKAVSIKGNLKGTGKSQYIYLFQYLTTELQKLDSAKLSNGEFKFKNKPFPHGIYRIGISEEKSLAFILAEEEIDIKGDLADPNANPLITGSKENELFSTFNQFNRKYNDEFSKLDQQAQPIIALRGSNPELFNTEIKKLQLVLDSLNKNRTAYFTQFQAANKNTFVGKLASPFLVSDTVGKKDYFTAADLSDPEMAGGDMLYNKIIMYLQKFSGQQINQLKEESMYLLSLPASGSKNKEAFYVSFIKIFAPYDPEYARVLASAYQKEFPSSTFAKKIEASLPKAAPQIGDTAPDIKLSNPSGKTVALSSYKGKIVLIDFWASWCGPCRHENPNVVKAYQKYKDKGFTIYSVSLDDNKEKWMQAIQKDGLVWDSHVSDLKGWQSGAAQLYQVKGIPATFLIGRDGKVVGTNLRGESLEAKLAELCQ